MSEFLGKLNKSALIFIWVHFKMKLMQTGNKGNKKNPNYYLPLARYSLFKHKNLCILSLMNNNICNIFLILDGGER